MVVLRERVLVVCFGGRLKRGTKIPEVCKFSSKKSAVKFVKFGFSLVSLGSKSLGSFSDNILLSKALKKGTSMSHQMSPYRSHAAKNAHIKVNASFGTVLV